jgi:hypothetical protein
MSVPERCALDFNSIVSCNQLHACTPQHRSRLRSRAGGGLPWNAVGRCPVHFPGGEQLHGQGPGAQRRWFAHLLCHRRCFLRFLHQRRPAIPDNNIWNTDSELAASESPSVFSRRASPLPAVKIPAAVCCQVAAPAPIYERVVPNLPAGGSFCVNK